MAVTENAYVMLFRFPKRKITYEKCVVIEVDTCADLNSKFHTPIIYRYVFVDGREIGSNRIFFIRLEDDLIYNKCRSGR